MDHDEVTVEARLKRQQIRRRLDPPTLHAVLDESVLWRDAGGPEVIKAEALPVGMSKGLIADDGGTMGTLTNVWRKSTRSGGNGDDCVEITVIETDRS
jgi:hypothetical protein